MDVMLGGTIWWLTHSISKMRGPARMRGVTLPDSEGVNTAWLHSLLDASRAVQGAECLVLCGGPGSATQNKLKGMALNFYEFNI